MKTFLLTFIFCGTVTEVAGSRSTNASFVKAMQSRLKNESQYRRGVMQFRSLDGFKAVPVLPVKLKLNRWGDSLFLKKLK